jgi:hypothetical protein
MSDEVVIRCWNCQRKFTISASGANPAITIYRGETPSTSVESRDEKKRLLKTGPYCDAEKEIYL